MIMQSTGIQLNDARRKVYRARFSSVTEKDIFKAMDNLVEPNRNEALAVDARQEIDLKVGVAFTRFQTRYFQGKYGNLDSRVISLVLSSLLYVLFSTVALFCSVYGVLSDLDAPPCRLRLQVVRYGPCQTPTLGFCVQRYLQITSFKPEKFWALHPYIIQNGYEIKLEWERHKLFDLDVAMMFQKLVTQDGILEVIDTSEKQESKVRPYGLNTVNLLKVASSALGFGPQMAMQLAERLYTQGFIRFSPYLFPF
ncbi:hypothetical protein Patl1_26152 [Pistacia atlantica]|uniref:Uncharacterized protein n=1 Tax=Pistacia atlantica TaxID=434234 RepID=A0ACC1B461_9ROSI|nr:hypothetical protein Patl1_26152 [Pistacia atlantica]